MSSKIIKKNSQLKKIIFKNIGNSLKTPFLEHILADLAIILPSLPSLRFYLCCVIRLFLNIIEYAWKKQ